MTNNKPIIYIVLIAIAVVLVYFGLINNNSSKTSLSAKNATYSIDGRSVTLKDGVSMETSAPGSATEITTRYFGNEVTADFDNDGREDTAFLLTQDTGGSGTFYYVVASLNKEDGFVGSQAFFLGDRIAPQTTELGKNNIIIVNYADRNPGESFSVSPSVGKSVWLKLDPSTLQFGEVVQNFEGEADPSRMTLDMKKWNWVRTEYNDGRVITPKVPGKFTLTLNSDKTFTATTDCNSMGGKYDSIQSAIIFKNIFSTLMACQGSQEVEFNSFLVDTVSYHFTSKGELVLELKFDSGVVVFN